MVQSLQNFFFFRNFNDRESDYTISLLNILEPFIILRTWSPLIHILAVSHFTSHPVISVSKMRISLVHFWKLVRLRFLFELLLWKNWRPLICCKFTDLTVPIPNHFMCLNPMVTSLRFIEEVSGRSEVWFEKELSLLVCWHSG